MASRIKGITVEIGGDTTGLDKALKNVNSSIRTTQSSLRDVNRLLKLDPKNSQLLAQKQKLLQSAISDTKDKLEALKEADKEAKVQLDKGELGKDKYDALQREIIETENKLKGLESESIKASSALVKLSRSGEKLKSIGSGMENVGRKMSIFSAGILASGTASAKLAMSFEDAMAKVNTIADTSQVPLKELEKSIIDLSNQTGISSSEIAENVYNAISAGQETGDAVKFVAESTKLAKAGFADSASALDVLTTIMNAYSLEATEVNNVSDMLIQTQNLGKTTVGQLSSSMGKVIPTANSYGVALDQLCAGYAIMTSNGIATAESTTYMNAMLNELGKSGTGVSKVLKDKTGMSFKELMDKGYSLSDVLAIVKQSADEEGLAFTDMFSSSEAAKAGLTLLGDSADNFNGVLSKMNNSTGATDTAFSKLKTNSFNIQVTINKLKNTLIELGGAILQVLAPVFESLSSKVSALTTWFSSLDEGTKQTIVKIGLIVASVGPLLIVIAKIISAVGTIMTIIPQLTAMIAAVKTAFAALNLTMLSNPIFLIIAAITALVAAFIYLWNNCEGFREFWINLWEQIKQALVTAWNAISEFFTTIFETISLMISTVWTGIKNFFIGIWEGIKLVFETVLGIIKAVVTTYFTIYKTIILTILNGIKLVVTTIWNAIKVVIRTVVNTIKAIISTVFNTIKSIITTILGGIKSVVTSIWNAIKQVITGVVHGVKRTVSSVFNGVKNTVTSIFNGIKSTATSVWNGIKNAIINPIKSAKDKVKGIVDSITGFFSGMKLSLPKIKLPHFRISGRLSIAPPSIPKLSIDWYKEGGIMTKPTLFGLNGSSLMAGGEAGAEAILPLKGFYNNLEKMLNDRSDTTIMEKYLSIIAENSMKEIYLEDGTLVGRLLPSIDEGLGRLSVRKERG